MNEQQQLPNELLQKMRETLAYGIAENMISKALEELQSNEPEAIKV